MARGKVNKDFAKLKKDFKELEKLQVRVGYQRGKTITKPTDELTSEDVDMVDIAAWNELGTYNIPARPFLKQSVDNNKDEIEAFIKSELKSIGTKSPKQILQRIGAKQKGVVQKTIRDGDFVPNAPITREGGWMKNQKSGKPFKVKGKGKNKTRPLKNTGQLEQSVQYVIEEK